MYEEQLHRLQHKLFVLQYISVQGKSYINTGVVFSVRLRDWALNEFDMQRYTHVLNVEIKNCITPLGKQTTVKSFSPPKIKLFILIFSVVSVFSCNSWQENK